MSLKAIRLTHKHIFISYGACRQRRSSEQRIWSPRSKPRPSRRACAFCCCSPRGELNVKDLTLILGQSQPRISRHLKLLGEAGLIERFREGSWVYFHISDRAARAAGLALRLVADVDPAEPAVRRDRERAEALKREREAAAQSYLRQARRRLGSHPRAARRRERSRSGDARGAWQAVRFKLLVDLGTGTGRTLELFADRFERGLGIDVNQAMLAYARSQAQSARLRARASAPWRHLRVVACRRCADAVVMHQMLHFLSDPSLAIREAARVLAPGRQAADRRFRAARP